MANCSCRLEDLHSLSQLCESCTAEYLRISEDAELQNELARRYGCQPETLGLIITEEESHALAKASAQDSYEDTAATLRRSLDIHTRKIADLELRLAADAERIDMLTASVRSLVQIAITRRVA